METLNEMCELTPPCECDCNPDKDLSQGNIRPNYSPSPCGADSGVCGEHLLEHPLHLWAIKYGVEGYLKHIGVAVIQAPTRSAAECIFAKNSLFSGTPERLKILAMKEVMPWSEPILFEDSAAILDRHNLKSYPFLLKSDYEQNIQNIMETIINSIEEQIGEKVEITVDLSNYYDRSQTYSKEEVDGLIDGIEDHDTTYTGSGDVEVNPTTHVISLKKQIPDPVDLSDYAKTEDLPKVHNGKLTISVNGQAVEFTANSENDVLLEIAIPESYTLPVATNEVLGGIKVGTNLSITPEGVLSAVKGTEINDNAITENTTWSSQKISAELQAAIRTFNSFNIVSVGVLPTTGEERTLYLVNKASNDAKDVKDEYLWVNGHWEKIGSASIDMSNYYTKDDIRNMLALLYQGDETTIHIGEDHVVSLIPNTEVIRDLIPAQKQADWNEDSESSAAFIKNKPQLKQVATSGSYNDLIDKPEIPEPAPQIQADWNEQDNSSPAYIKNKPTSLEPIEYRGEGGVIVDNDTHVIRLEEGIIPQEPETPSNYYQYNNLNIIVPQDRGIIRLAHDYIMPSGANPSVYERGVYIEDVTISVPATAQELEYMTVMVQYPVNNGPDNAPLFATINSHYAASSAYDYNHPQQFRIPINAKGSIVRDTNTQQYYYDEILRNGDFCYDNVGNLFVIDNLKSDTSGSGGWIDFRLVPKLRAYYNDDNSVSTDMFTTQRFKSSDYSSNYSSAEDSDDVYSYAAEINGQSFGNLPHSDDNYQYTYRFISAYKNPETEKVFYVYGSPNESVALACYMREMDDNNIRPAFAGFLLFGTPWSLEPPIERNDTELEIAASTWIEPRPQIFYIEASSINDNVSNIDTTNLQENDIVVIKNPSTSISYQDGDDTITINDLSFEPQFRYDGTGFKPMFSNVNETSHYVTDSEIGWIEH